jgi:hypothetical protein
MPPEKKARRDLITGAVERNLPSKPWWLRLNITAFLNQITLEAGRHLTEALVELGACRQEAKTSGKPTNDCGIRRLPTLRWPETGMWEITPGSRPTFTNVFLSHGRIAPYS